MYLQIFQQLFNKCHILDVVESDRSQNEDHGRL